MIIRIVRMYFSEESAEDFLEIFERTQGAIQAAEGCLHLELLRQPDAPYSFATLSHWQAESDLHNYRKSPLFKSVWARVKPLFIQPADAFSLEQIAGA